MPFSASASAVHQKSVNQERQAGPKAPIHNLPGQLPPDLQGHHRGVAALGLVGSGGKVSPGEAPAHNACASMPSSRAASYSTCVK